MFLFGLVSSRGYSLSFVTVLMSWPGLSLVSSALPWLETFVFRSSIYYDSIIKTIIHSVLQLCFRPYSCRIHLHQYLLEMKEINNAVVLFVQLGIVIIYTKRTWFSDCLALVLSNLPLPRLDLVLLMPRLAQGLINPVSVMASQKLSHPHHLECGVSHADSWWKVDWLIDWFIHSLLNSTSTQKGQFV